MYDKAMQKKDNSNDNAVSKKDNSNESTQDFLFTARNGSEEGRRVHQEYATDDRTSNDNAVSKKDKYGVFGGTFDPVHCGHMEVARRAILECGLDKLIVVPANEQPLKTDRALAPGHHRMNMLKLAFSSDDNIVISDIELKKGSLSYTVDTLRDIRRIYGEAEIFFVVGIDSFLKIELWKEPGALLRDFPFIVAVRPGYMENELEELAARVKESFGARIFRISNALIPVSSTKVRDGIRLGEDFGDGLVSEVKVYITENGLYT